MSTQTYEGMYDDDDGYPNDGKPFGDKWLLENGILSDWPMILLL